MPFRSSSAGLQDSLTVGQFSLVMQKCQSSIPVGRDNHTDTLSTPHLNFWPKKSPIQACQTGGPNSGYFLAIVRPLADKILNATLIMNSPLFHSFQRKLRAGRRWERTTLRCRIKLCLRLDQALSSCKKSGNTCLNWNSGLQETVSYK